jgi:hypothetical protein
MREFALPEDLIIDAVAGFSEQDAIAVIISAIAARFDGPSLAKIVADLGALQQHEIGSNASECNDNDTAKPGVLPGRLKPLPRRNR